MSYIDHSGYREQLVEFIHCYRNEPCLWQLKSKHYYDRNKKDAAYDRLIAKYKSIDPSANRDAVVKKINNLRTTYRKELKKLKQSRKLGEDNYAPRLWYFHLLDFLYEQDNPATRNASEDENDEISNEVPDSPQSLHQPTCMDPHLQLPPLYNDSDGERNTPASTHRLRPGTKARVLADEVIWTENDHFAQLRSEDRFDVYGKNVAMKLRDLPELQRILAEKIINDALFLAEMNSLTVTHTVRNSDAINSGCSCPVTRPHCSVEFSTTDIKTPMPHL